MKKKPQTSPEVTCQCAEEVQRGDLNLCKRILPHRETFLHTS